MEFWEIICLSAYVVLVLALSVYGSHRYLLLRLFYKHGAEPQPPAACFESLSTSNP